MIRRYISFLDKLCILIGNRFAQVGFLIFGFGFFFASLFVKNSDYPKIYFLISNTIKTTGTITEINPTNFTIGGKSGRSGKRVYEYRFTFLDAGKIKRYNGVAYKTGKYYKIGDKVTIEYPKGFIKYAKIKGMRNKPFPIFTLIIIIAPFVGIGLITAGYLKSAKQLKVLESGVLTNGKLISKIKIPGQNISYTYNFVFKTDDGREYKAKFISSEDKNLDNDIDNLIAYLEENPEISFPIASYPVKIELNNDGRIVKCRFFDCFKIFLIPILTMLVIGLNFIFVY